MSVEFLRLRRRNIDLAAPVQRDREAQIQDVDAQTQAVAGELLNIQGQVENQVAPALQQVSAINVLTPLEQRVEAVRLDVARLRVIQKQLQGDLQNKQGELRTGKVLLMQYSAELDALSKAASQVHPSHQATIEQLGQQISQNIRQRTGTP